MERTHADHPLVVYAVDDDPGVRSLLTQVLERHAYEVRCFRSADEAKIAVTHAALRRAPVDAVLLDMRLTAGTESTRDAEDLLDTITRRQPQPAVIVMSGHLSSDDFMRLILKGATDFLPKPWDMRDLLTRVGDCADEGRQRFRHYYSAGTARTRPDRDAFLSYSSRNTQLALGLKRVLERMGVSTWYAPADLSPGEHWPDSLDVAIHRCWVFLVLLTADSIESDHVINEVRKALTRRAVEPERFLLIPMSHGLSTDRLPENLRALQTINLTDQNSFVDNIIRLADRISQFVESLRRLPEHDRRGKERRAASNRRRS